MTRNTIFKGGLVLLLVFISVFGFRYYRKSNGSFSVEVKRSEAGILGYQIFKDKQLIIEQFNVPGAAGTTGFADKKQAEQVAGLMVEKMSKGVFPPTVSQAELDSLHIIY